jgi:hypothetical protein
VQLDFNVVDALACCSLVSTFSLNQHDLLFQRITWLDTKKALVLFHFAVTRAWSVTVTT